MPAVSRFRLYMSKKRNKNGLCGVFVGMSSRAVAWLILLSLPCDAVPIPIEPLTGAKIWMLPGGEQGAALTPGRSVAVEVLIPELNDKEKEAGGTWRGILSIDAFGTRGGALASLVLEAMDPRSGEVFASTTISVKGTAPRAAWAVIASSEQGGSAADRLFDGDPQTDWHSRYGENQPMPPHWVGLDFGFPQKLEGVCYVPRQGGFTNGVARKYRVEVRKEADFFPLNC